VDLPEPIEPTQAQLRILVRAAAGMTRQEIADDLHYSPWTIKRRLAEAHELLGARNTPQALAICIARGYLCVDGRAEVLFIPDPLAIPA
jgi:DNA-binding CsgD family transcriptional regulator